MRHPSSAARFEWDSANEDKLAERKIRPDEVEAIWMMVGRDPRSGRRLRVGILWADEKEGVLRAIHALEVVRGRQG